jgi:formylmethanofuran dehydrogenase subunit A
MGQVIFTDTTTMTADGPFQFGLYGLTGNKWTNHDVETETSAGIVPFHYRRKNYAHSIQWTIGLELALLIKDPWKIFMTTDHPNGGPFTSYPRIIAWLMSEKARKATLKKINARARSRSILPSIDRELDFHQIAILTRAGPARALGLTGKGHLGVGADADIAVYDFDPEKTDVSKKYKAFRKALKRAAFTTKSGEIVVKDGEIVQSADGSTIWLDVDVSEHAHITDDMKRKFRQYWTVEFENYPVTEHYLKASRPIRVKADV